MLVHNSFVTLAAITGDTPQYFKNALNKESNFNPQKIMNYIVRGLIGEDFMAKFKVTDEDFSLVGTKSKSVSLGYYMYRKFVDGDVKDRIFKQMRIDLAETPMKKLSFSEEEVTPTVTLNKAKKAGGSDDKMHLVFYINTSNGRNERAMALMNTESMNNLFENNPGVIAKNVSSIYPDWFSEMIDSTTSKGLAKLMENVSMAAPSKATPALVVRNRPGDAVDEPKDAQKAFAFSTNK